MKILCLQRGEPGSFLAWIEEDGKYKKVILDDDGGRDELTEVEVSKYTDYEHFVGVMSKFNPDYIFLDEPKEIAEPVDFEDLEQAMLQIDRETRKLK